MRAYYVTGPESSGNRYMTRCLVSAGCAGRGSIEQPWDGPFWELELPPRPPERLAVFRSAPHGRVKDVKGVQQLWPDISEHLSVLKDAGYEVDVLFMTRDRDITARSQLRSKHALSLDIARERVSQAENHIFSHLTRADMWHRTFRVIYHHLGNPDYRRNLARRLDLPEFTEPFVDGNAKYREGVKP